MVFALTTQGARSECNEHMEAAAPSRRLMQVLMPLCSSTRALAAAGRKSVHWHLPDTVKDDMTVEQLSALSGAGERSAALQVSAHEQQRIKSRKDEQRKRQRQRLMELGEGASIEVSPAQAGAPPRPSSRPGLQPAPKPLKFTVAGAMDEFLAGDNSQRPPLSPGTLVFVNMVKTDQAHFDDVAEAVGVLSTHGLCPVPHLPACRFDSLGAVAPILDQLRDAGSTHALMLLGGNDQQERSEAGAPFGGADALLESGAVSAANTGVECLMLAGHPEGHPGLGFDKCKTAELLERKVRAAVVEQGYREISVVSQLCFDSATLLDWLDSTRSQLGALVAAIEAEELETATTVGGDATEGSTVSAVDLAARPLRSTAHIRLRYYVGVPGPTAAGRLRRVAEICEVTSPTLAKLMQGDGSGTTGKTDTEVASEEQDVWPEELVRSVVRYCCREHQYAVQHNTSQATSSRSDDSQQAEDFIRLHVFPFGGVSKALEMIERLADGRWPHMLDYM
eukprot:COSAG02_NODE_3433_length_6750_cov_29.777477_2_plen_507_part_00